MLKTFPVGAAAAVGGALASLLVSAALVSTAYAYELPQAGPNEPVYSAIVEVGVGFLGTSADLKEEDSIDDESFPVIEGAARANIPLAANVSIQLDLDGFLGINERDEDDGDDYLQNFFFASWHLTWRDPSRAAAGVLLSYGESNGAENEEAQVFFFGGEAQGYFDNLTLYGQAGYMVADDENENDVITDAFWLRGVGRYFFGPNQRLQGEFAYINGEENDSGADTEVGWAWGARFDQGIRNGPLTFFVSYRGSHIDNDDSSAGSLTDHTALVGLALQLGAKDLKDEDRRGATLDTPAWAMGRWTGWLLEVVD